MTYKKKAAAGGDGSLHEAAYGIAKGGPPIVPGGAAAEEDRLWTVTGVPIDSLRCCAFAEETASALQNWRLGGGEHRLEHSNHKLGQGSCAQVFQGQEVTPFSLPDLMTRAAEMFGEHKLIMYLLFPWIPTMQVLVSKQLRLYSWRALSALSEDVRRHALRVANQWGVGHFVHDALLRVRPCAVKVLPCDSFHGAYGPRSAENEVLITLHVTKACAACPHVGRAYGFEYATTLPGTPNTLACIDPASTPQRPSALLLALELYTVNLRAAHDAASGVVTAAATSTASADIEPVEAVSSAPGPTCEEARQSNPPSCCEGGVAARGEAAVNLREYLVWLYRHHRTPGEGDMKRIALQLSRALHSLHTDAHVMHLDVKPQNVLVDGRLDLKLVDFGFAAAFTHDKPYIRMQRHGRGTPMFTAPEMMCEYPRLITTAADVFSLGCCLLSICSLSYLTEPYAPRLRLAPRSTPRSAGPITASLVQMGANNCSFPVPSDVPAAFQGIIAACLQRDPAARPTAAQVIEDLEAIVPVSAPPALSVTPAATPSLPSDDQSTSAVQSHPIELPDFAGGSRGGAAVVPPALPPTPPPAAPPLVCPCHLQSDGSISLGSCSGILGSESLTPRPSDLAPAAAGNTVALNELGAAPSLQALSVAPRSTNAMRYTKSLRDGLAGVMLASITSLSSAGSGCWNGSQASRSVSGGTGVEAS